MDVVVQCKRESIISENGEVRGVLIKRSMVVNDGYCVCLIGCIV